MTSQLSPALRTEERPGQPRAQVALHPGHRSDGDRLGAGGLPRPGLAAPPGGAVAGLVGDQVVAGGQDAPAGLALVDHPALSGAAASPAGVRLHHCLEKISRHYLGSPQVFTDCLQFIHFVSQKVLLQFKSHCFPQP